ncbi:hypothetical protein V1504DRAFT_437057 [Lipomyces starkeyi]
MDWGKELMKDLLMKDLRENPSLKAIHGEFAIHTLQSADNSEVYPPPSTIYVSHLIDNARMFTGK